MTSSRCPDNKKIPERGFRRFISERNLGRSFGESTESSGGEAQLHTTDALGLEVDRKRTATVALGVANFVAGLGTPTGHLADT